MRLKVVLAASLGAIFAPGPAFAQPSSTPAAESEKAWTEVQQQAAEAENAQDCAIACRALESLARATQHLCDIGPEHCEEARAKLREATARVRAACPDCAATGAPPSPRMEATQPHGGGDQAVATSAPAEPGRGGCASCNASDSAGDLVAPALAALAILASRRKRRRP